MKSILYAGAMLAASMTLASCGQDGADRNTGAAANQSAPAGGTSSNASGEAADGALQGGAAQQDFSVVNNTGHVVMTLNVSPSNENEWGPDILGTDTLANGETAEVTFQRGSDQCLWDIRVTYDDGDTGDMRGVNLCEVATVTLTP
ncbi:hypothetical protein [Sphingosinicella sp. YJ22]|uniref:hypothetical protein n=1 Tax=Sphingosinicella sp. YJ22 TaxID=1104780 RepID=UPI00140D440D|nr:hypothetical protein [Sphingosinicella sp. YJ22]